jgi:antitoxin YefM
MVATEFFGQVGFPGKSRVKMRREMQMRQAKFQDNEAVDPASVETHTWTGTLTKCAAMNAFTYSYARENLASLWDHVEDAQEEVILQRRGHEDLALVPAKELKNLQETAHLLRSPANALRLLRALTQSRTGAKAATFETTEELAAELGL